MPLNNGIPSIIHTAAAANVTAFTYTKVYASVAASPTINGIAIPMVAGGTIDVLVRTISTTGNVFVLGDKVTTSNPGGTDGVIL